MFYGIMKFKPATLDTRATIITIVVTIFFIGLSYIFITKPFGWIFVLLFFLILFISYLLSLKEYQFDQGKLIIKKVCGKKIVIPLNTIEEYIFIPDITKLNMLRTFGNGGLFGYYGIFSSMEYGPINLQLTAMKNVFMIKTKKGNYAVSPLAIKEFEEYLKGIVTAETGKIGKMEKEAVKIVYARPKIIILPLIIFLLTILVILLFYQRLPRMIALHFDIHGNPDRWGPKTAFLSSNLIPAIILFIFNIILFFLVRRVTHKPSIPNLLVIIFSVIQLFIMYVAIDIYWSTMYQRHIVSIFWPLLGLVIISGILLFYYHKRIVKNST